MTSQSVLVPIIQDTEEVVGARLEDGNNRGAESLNAIVKHLGSLADIIDEAAKVCTPVNLIHGIMPLKSGSYFFRYIR